jgi:hypothetical protein
LGARDFARQRAFYLGLGWPPRIDVEDFVSFLVGGVILAIHPLDKLTEEAAPGMKANGEWSGIALACNVATRDEVDDAWAAWVAAGATPLHEPFDREYGPRTGYVADPEGNRWEIGCRRCRVRRARRSDRVRRVTRR